MVACIAPFETEVQICIGPVLVNVLHHVRLLCRGIELPSQNVDIKILHTHGRFIIIALSGISGLDGIIILGGIALTYFCRTILESRSHIKHNLGGQTLNVDSHRIFCSSGRYRLFFEIILLNFSHEVFHGFVC